MVFFRHNLPQPTQAQLMRGEFPETLCIEQGVVLSYRFAERKVRRAPRVLRMAVVSQSSVKFGKKRVLLLVMVWPGEQYISGAFQAQSSSAYSSSTDEG